MALLPAPVSKGREPVECSGHFGPGNPPCRDAIIYCKTFRAFVTEGWDARLRFTQ